MRSTSMHRLIFLPLALGLAACVSTTPIEPQLASASIDFSNARQVTIELDSFDFAPRDLQLAAGQPVELVFTNISGDGHNFGAADFFAAAQIRSEDADAVRNGLVELRGNQSVSVFLVPAAGNYEVDCTHLGHATLGMVGTVTVS